MEELAPVLDKIVITNSIADMMVINIAVRFQVIFGISIPATLWLTGPRGHLSRTGNWPVRCSETWQGCATGSAQAATFM
jgi:hypothetical protein